MNRESIAKELISVAKSLTAEGKVPDKIDVAHFAVLFGTMLKTCEDIERQLAEMVSKYELDSFMDKKIAFAIRGLLDAECDLSDLKDMAEKQRRM